MSTDISPKVRELVKALNAAGWPTCDSGDGSNHAAGMECARDYPHVVIRLPFHRRTRIYEEAKAVQIWLNTRGVRVETQGLVGDGWQAPCIQASLDPVNELALIDVMHVTDDMLKEPGRLSF